MTVVATNLFGLSQQVQVLKQTVDALCTRVDQVVSVSPVGVEHVSSGDGLAGSSSAESAIVSPEDLQRRVGGLCERLGTLEAAFAAVHVHRPFPVAGGCGQCHNLSTQQHRHTPLYDLYWACSSGCVACVRSLLRQVSDVNGVSLTNRWTAMDFLVWGHNEATEGRAHPVDLHDFDGVRELLSQAGCKRSDELI
jgi:hypothetical protein